MKKHSLYIIIFLFYAVQLYSFQSMDGGLIKNEDIVGFTIEPSFGYLYGQAREIVFDNSGSSTQSQSSFNGYYLSELIWDLSSLYYAGISASLNFKNRIYINAGIWTSINSGDGYMNDYDWVSGVPLHDRDGRTDLSHWSLSSVEIVDSLIIDINIAYDFLPVISWDFSILVGYKNLYWDWNDTILDSFHEGVADVLTVGSDGIDYKLNLSVPYFGLGGGWMPNGGFYLKGSFIYSPFVDGDAHDHHYRKAHFYDSISFGHYLSGSLKTGYKFPKIFSLFIQLSGQYLFEARGDTQIYSETGEYDRSIYGGAGIQYQALSVSLNAAFSF